MRPDVRCAERSSGSKWWNGVDDESPLLMWLKTVESNVYKRGDEKGKGGPSSGGKTSSRNADEIC